MRALEKCCRGDLRGEKKHKLHVQFEQGGGERERASEKQTVRERRSEQSERERVSRGGGYGWRRVLENNFTGKVSLGCACGCSINEPLIMGTALTGRQFNAIMQSQERDHAYTGLYITPGSRCIMLQWAPSGDHLTSESERHYLMA